MIDQKTFWSINPENGKLSPEILDTYIFLAQRGYRKRTREDEVEVFRQCDYLVEQSFVPNQINEITSYLKEQKESTKLSVAFPRKGSVDFEYKPKEILEKFVKYGWSKIFNDNNFNHLPELQVNIKRHTRDAAFFYFKNGYVEVTKAGKKFHPYSTLAGQCIYKDHLIQRDIALVDIYDPVQQDFAKRGYDFLDFLNRLAGVPLEINEAAGKDTINTDIVNKLQFLMRSIGFLLHDYKQQGLTDFGIILCDDNAGGTGKGIIVQSLRQMTSVAEIDAQKDETFDPLDLTERTRIKVFNDVQPNFNFKTVYNQITDQAVIRHMHKNPRYVPYAESWKVLFTSNHVIRGNSGADLRRQRVFLVNQFFSENNLLVDHYGHSFFSTDWNERDWNFFYNIMFECVREWLNCDYKLKYVDQDFTAMKLEEEYPAAFRSYIDELVAELTPGTTILKPSELYYKFKEHERYRLDPFVKKLNTNFFGRLLTRYLTEMKIQFTRNQYRTEIWITKSKK
jgi:hypothetical protein